MRSERITHEVIDEPRGYASDSEADVRDERFVQCACVQRRCDLSCV